MLLPTTGYLCLFALIMSAVEASLRDILNYAMETVKKIAYTPDEDEDAKIVSTLSEGCKTLKKLTLELSRLGKNAFDATFKDKDLDTQKKVAICAAKKATFANDLYQMKKQEIKECGNASSSLIEDVAGSFMQSAEPFPKSIENSETDCRNKNCIRKPDTQSSSYDTWGSRLSAVHRCVEDVINHLTIEFRFIFKSLRQECFSNDFKRRMQSQSLNESNSMNEQKAKRKQKKRTMITT